MWAVGTGKATRVGSSVKKIFSERDGLLDSSLYLSFQWAKPSLSHYFPLILSDEY